jgi:hypothetical protein
MISGLKELVQAWTHDSFKLCAKLRRCAGEEMAPKPSTMMSERKESTQ